MGAPTWSWISRRVERSVLEEALKHVGKILEVGEATVKVMEAFVEGSQSGVSEAFSEVDKAEGEADSIKREIIRGLSEGFIHPVDREELIRLILATDDIAAYLKAASRKARIVAPSTIDVEVRKYALRMAERVREAIKLLTEAFTHLTTDKGKALELSDSVERIEEEVDDIRDDALRKVFEFCDNAPVSACLVSKEIIDSLENSADRCEDVADVVRSIAVLHG